MIQANALEGGFRDAPRDAAIAFRALMTAMARPGYIETVSGAEPPAPLSLAAGVALLTLTDPDTPVFLAGNLDTDAVRAWIAFHTGAPFSGPSHAAFAVGPWASLMPLERFPAGTPEYPDRSTTLIVECASLEATGTTLSGPGIRETSMLKLPDPNTMRWNNARFPLGLDFYLTCGARLAALPRSTRIG